MREITLDEQGIEKAYKKLFDLSKEICCISNFDGFIELVNPAFIKVTGYSEKELLNESFSTYIHPDDLESSLKIFDNIKSGENIDSFENRILCKSGEYKTIQWNTSIDKETNLYYSVGLESVFLDINKKLNESETLLEGVFEQAAVGVVNADLNGKLILVNKKAATTLGYKKEELTGKTIEDLTIPDDFVNEKKFINQLLNKEIDHYIIEKRLYRKDGSTLRGKVTVSVVWDETNEQPINLVGVIEDISEKIEAEKALKESEQKFRTIFESAKDHITLFDTKANILDINFTAEGITKEQVIGANLFEDFYKTSKSYESIKKAFNKTLKSKTPQPNENEVFIGGKTVHFSTNFSPVLNENGEVKNLISISRDISNSKLAEIALKESEQKFRAIFENAPDYILLLNADANIIDFNISPNGIDSDELIGTNVFDYYQKNDSLLIAKEAFKKLLKEKTRQQYESYLILDDKKHYFSIINSPLLNESGEIEKIISVSRDITQQKNAEKALKVSEEKFRTMFASAPDYITLLDTSAIILDVNRTAVGLTKKDVIGVCLFDFYQKDKTLSIVKNTFEKVIKLKTIQRNITHTLINNQDLYLATVFSPILNKEGEIDKILCISSDITEQKIAEIKLKEANDNLENRIKVRTKDIEDKNLELERANSYLDEFVYTAAHDLRSPVVSLQSLYNLYVNYTDNQNSEKILKRIGESIKQLQITLDSLIHIIDLNKDEKSQAEFVDLEKICKEVLRIYEDKIFGNKVKLTIDFSNCRTINYVSVYITSLLQNLISNAIKYQHTSRFLKLNIRSYDKNEYNVIEVKDNGIGIDLKKHNEIMFQPFKRLTKDGEGKGIGLNLVKKIVEKNGGKIEVESELDKGSVFRLFLKPY